MSSRRLIRFITATLSTLVLVLSLSAAPAQAYSWTTRSCWADKSQMWGSVSVIYHPSTKASQRRLVSLRAREYRAEPTGVRGVYNVWRLRYVGLRGTSRTWGPNNIPSRHYDFNVQRRYTFYFQSRAGFWPPVPNYAQCTVVI